MSNFRVYIIKCVKTEKCYISYTDSNNQRYNPLSYLYSIYKKNKDKYIELGKSIEEHGLKQHKCLFVKTGLTKDEASEVTNKLRENTSDRSLHDGNDNKSLFEKELSLIMNDVDIIDV